ncbi:MAG: hypothetical protein EOO39_08240, partial [Cytophagaceae bacterium]
MKEALNQIGESIPFKAALTDYFRTKPVKRAYLFGSYVRGEQSETSDIDILVELDYEQGADFFGFIQMQDELTILLKKPVDLLSANGLSTFIKPYIDADIPSVPSPAAHDSNNGNDSDATTPRGPGGADDSGWSNLGEIPDERKAQVLRRHLVSAEERGQSKTGTPTGMSPGNASPIGEGGPRGGPGDSAVTYGSTSENPPQADDQFPI